MYLGTLVEVGEVDSGVPAPYHPYTQALLSAIPIRTRRWSSRRERILLHGDCPTGRPALRLPVPHPLPAVVTLGPLAQQLCVERDPPRATARVSADSGHEVACHHARVRRSCEAAVLLVLPPRADRLRERGQPASDGPGGGRQRYQPQTA